MAHEPTTSAPDWLAPLAPTERPFDYCLLPYEPPASPDHKLPSAWALARTHALGGATGPAAGAMVGALREALGPGRTVWGAKLDATSGELSWELYFYRNPHQHPDLSVARVAAALAPWLRVRVPSRELPPWLMFSVAFDRAALAGPGEGELTVYVAEGNLAYRYAGDEVELRNHYLFLDPRGQIEQVLTRLRHLVHASVSGPALATLLPPGPMREARHICCAAKRHHDAIYFSRVRGPQLVAELRRLGWPPELLADLEAAAPRLDHLLWDYGYDVRRVDGALAFERSGFYGYF
ncbi:MAG: hypothetical protein EOO75_07890 [Myxococcales bacterium]|nr:MAG: hypothetical protein EOO75_07890 [Myxococcales bacterium]